MTIGERIKKYRNEKGLSQRDFARRINVGHSSLAQLESGVRVVKDIHIAAICREFLINELWLRTGEGDMLKKPDVVSLDAYAREKNISPLEIQIIKGLMDLPAQTRNDIISHFKKVFSSPAVNESAANIEAGEDYIFASTNDLNVPPVERRMKDTDYLREQLDRQDSFDKENDYEGKKEKLSS